MTQIQSIKPFNPTHTMYFRYTWRPYQKRVLEEIHKHLNDQKLHIVAAPGSGKTVLGLEVFRILGKPAMVLSPTRIVRDQWIERLSLFLSDKITPETEWRGSDFNNLAFFNSITYQRLYSESDNTDESDSDSTPDKRLVSKIISKLNNAGIETIILDEAHHLKAAWWVVLNDIVNGLKNVNLVCLTATPPYDATGREWEKYTELCGPIDEEISVPELIREKNLCPHHDYVYITSIDSQTIQSVSIHKQKKTKLLNEMLLDPMIHFSVQNHSFIKAEAISIDDVFSKVGFTIALCAYLKASNSVVPFRLLHLLELKEAPDLDDELWTYLFSEFFYGSGWPEHPNVEIHRKEIAGRFRAAGLLSGRTIDLSTGKKLAHTVQHTISKVQAILQITSKEWEIRREWLRQVILIDHIHGDLSVSDIRDGKLTLGVWPVFTAIVTTLSIDVAQRFCMITGNLVIVPVTVFTQLCTTGNITGNNFTEIEDLPNFYSLTGISSSLAVSLITNLLHDGFISGIVGTTALLGEGWDAPCVNSLILGGYANSYVLTNQSRGRAIRFDSSDPQKVASIWHLLAVGATIQSDQDDLARRFNCFTGISNFDNKIESSIERLDLPQTWNSDTIKNHNEKMFSLVSSPDTIRKCWNEAVISEQKRLTPVVIDRAPPQIQLHIDKHAGIHAGMAIFGIGMILFGLSPVIHQPMENMIISTGLLLLSIYLFPYIPLFLRWMRLRSQSATLHAIADALIHSLKETGELNSDQTSVMVTDDPSGEYTIYLQGGTFYEKTIFSNSMREILSPIENPRYIVPRVSVKGKAYDYHSVPSVFGIRKETALIFHKWWCYYMGKSKMLFTRNEDGRLIVLRARAQSIANKLLPRKNRNRWI